MTDGPHRRSPGKWLRSLSADDRFTSTVGISQIVGGVAAVVAVVLTAWTCGGPTDVSARNPAAAPTSSRPSVSNQPPLLEKCWTATLLAVDCRETHRYEAIGVTPSAHCGLSKVVEYLGGLIRLDVTVARPRLMEGTICSLDAARDVRGSAKGVLQTASAPWRKCHHSRTDRVVPCSIRHTGEFVATGSLRRATLAACVTAATRYLNQDVNEIGQDLQVRVLDIKTDDPAPERCLIEVRGNHTLSGSVRNLGVNPVPLS